MSDDQPTPTTAGYPWAPPDGTTASGPAAPVPYDAGIGHPTPAGAPYSRGYPTAPAPTGYPSPPTYPPPPTYPYGPGYPPAHGPVAYPGPRPYDGFAIAGFVLSFVGAVVLSIIFGVLGLVRTKGGRARGRGLAIASLVISSLWFVVGIGLVIYGATLGPVSTYTVGDCVRLSDDADAGLDEGDAPTLPKVACSEPHNAEVYAAKNLPSGSYPGLDRVEQETFAYCESEYARFVGVPYDDSRLDFFIVYPEQIGWYTGDRKIACIVTAPEDVTSTLRGSAR